MGQNYKFYVNKVPVHICAKNENFPADEEKSYVLSLGDIMDEEVAAYIDSLSKDYEEIYLCGDGVDDKDVLKELTEHYNFIEAAGGVVQNEKGQILMIYKRGMWDLPKGKIDEGEDVAEAALREITEETGVKPSRIIKPLSCTFHTYLDDNDYFLKKIHWFLMQADSSSSLTPAKEEEITEVQWIDVDRLPECMENSFKSIEDVLIESVMGVK